MDEEGTDDRDAFIRMAREFPVRTGIFTFGLPLFALFQLINGVVYEGWLLGIGAFAVLMVACSVQLTRYHLAAYRRQQLVQRWVDDG